MFRKAMLALTLGAALLLSIGGAQASHPSITGMVWIGGAPTSQCGAFPPPGHEIHNQDPKLGDQCYNIPPGAIGAHVTYKGVHAQSFIGCDYYGNQIRVWGGRANVSPTVVPTVAQSFTVTWRHDLPNCTTQKI